MYCSSASIRSVLLTPRTTFYHNLTTFNLSSTFRSLRIPHGNRLALLRKQQVLDAYAPAIGPPVVEESEPRGLRA